jgi:hypothetical protein
MRVSGRPFLGLWGIEKSVLSQPFNHFHRSPTLVLFLAFDQLVICALAFE